MSCEISFDFFGKLISKYIMKTKELIKRIKEIFIEKLKSKTGWGRNEILMCYKDAVNDALLEASENFIKDE